MATESELIVTYRCTYPRVGTAKTIPTSHYDGVKSRIADQG